MYALQVLCSSLALIKSILEEVPELLQEAVATVDTVGIPRLTLLNRTQEHLIEAKCVGTILLNNHIRINNVEHRLRHFFDSPTALVLTILQNELCILVVRAPSLESLDVENIS